MLTKSGGVNGCFENLVGYFVCYIPNLQSSAGKCRRQGPPFRSCHAGRVCPFRIVSSRRRQHAHRGRSAIAASSHRAGTPSRCRRGPGQKRGQILRSAPVARTKDTFRQQKNSFFVRLPGEKARVYKKIANFTARNFAYEALLLRMFSPLSFLRAWHISAGGADLSTPHSNECPHYGSKPL